MCASMRITRGSQLQGADWLLHGGAAGVVGVCPSFGMRTSHARCPSRPCTCSVMLVGWGGNNGTTVTGGILANKQ